MPNRVKVPVRVASIMVANVGCVLRTYGSTHTCAKASLGFELRLGAYSNGCAIELTRERSDTYTE